ncbi:MAG TPA: ScyD/ScyE family protein, partial [Luteitalea sp.]|nr:ScyD/ScyE family protein [Luteitalea sp.]
DAQVVQPYVSGLRSPVRTLPLPDGGLLVVESGLGSVNTGRVSNVDRDGRRTTLIDGLPSGFHGAANDPTGPSAVLLQGNRLFILIGNGDITLAGPGGTEIPNPAPSSPLFSSLLLLELPEGLGQLPTGFVLPRSAHEVIAGGGAVYLESAERQVARLSRLYDFPDYSPAPRPDAPANVLISNTFSMTGSAARIDVADSARNLVWSVSVADRTATVLASFPPVANNTGMGAPMVDPVPTSVRAWRDDLLVGFLTGFPFGTGASRVARIDRRTGEVSTLIPQLTTVLDVLPVTRGRGAFYVLEYSTNFLAGAPGRLLLVEDPARAPLPLVDTLQRPTSLSQDARTGDLYVTEIGNGRVVRIVAPR